MGDFFGTFLFLAPAAGGGGSYPVDPILTLQDNSNLYFT